MEYGKLDKQEEKYILKYFEHRKGPRYLWDNEDQAEYEAFKDGYIMGRDRELFRMQKQFKK